jgi:hypothetical protein
VAIHNPGEYQHIDLRRLGAQQRSGAGVHGRTRRQDIVDQHNAAAGNRRLTVGGDLERTLDVARPLWPRQADLLLGGADAL